MKVYEKNEKGQPLYVKCMRILEFLFFHVKNNVNKKVENAFKKK